MKFVCRGCNYRFGGDDPVECPYCGLESFEVEKDAEGLLDEIEGLLSG